MLKILSHPGIEEASLDLRTMCEKPEYRRIANTIGPIDAGLIYLAEQRKATILSEDLRRSRRMTHFRSLKVTHLENRISV